MKTRIISFLSITFLFVNGILADSDAILTKQRMQILCTIVNVTDNQVIYHDYPTADSSLMYIDVHDIDKVFFSDGKVLDYSSGKPVERTINIVQGECEHTIVYKAPEDKTNNEEIVNLDTVVAYEAAPILSVEDTQEVVVPLSNAEEIAKNQNDSLNKHNEHQSNKEDVEIIEEQKFIPTNYMLTESESIQKALANVNKYSGIYIFNDNDPICDYLILGRISKSIGLNYSYESVRNALVQKALKKYPQADAVILELEDGGKDIAVAIKFYDSCEKNKRGYAKVQQMDGLYVFSDCEPINNYTILGRTKVSITWSGQYDSVKSKLIKKALKVIPNARGIIISFTRGTADKGVIIDF